MLRKIFYSMIVFAFFAFGPSACVNHDAVLARAQADYRTEHYSEAFHRMYYLAKTGDARAQYALGNMYFYGEGTVEDQDYARHWIRLAAYKRYPPAVHALYLMERSNVQQIVAMENNRAGYPKGKCIPREKYCVKVVRPKKIVSNIMWRNKPCCEVPHCLPPMRINAKNVNNRHMDFNWAKQQDESNYTVQLTVSSNKYAVNSLCVKPYHGLKAIPYQFRIGGETRYSAVCGTFSSLSEASAFKAKLPEDVARTAAVYPWRVLHQHMHPYS